MVQKFLALTLIFVLVSGFAAIASPFHMESDYAAISNLSFRNTYLQNTVRLGAEGTNFSLDIAMLYSEKKIKGIGPSFSLDKWGLTFQADGFVWPEKIVQLSAKFKIAPITNMNIVARSGIDGFNPEFGLGFGIEL